MRSRVITAETLAENQETWLTGPGTQASYLTIQQDPQQPFSFTQYLLCVRHCIWHMSASYTLTATLWNRHCSCPHLFHRKYFILFLNWNIVALHCCVSFSVSSGAQSCPILCHPMDCSMPGLPVHRQLPEITQTYVHWVSDAIQPSHPLSSPSPPAFNLSWHHGLFQWVSSSHKVAKVLEFLLQHQSFQWIFRTDFL